MSNETNNKVTENVEVLFKAIFGELFEEEPESTNCEPEPEPETEMKKETIAVKDIAAELTMRMLLGKDGLDILLRPDVKKRVAFSIKNHRMEATVLEEAVINGLSTDETARKHGLSEEYVVSVLTAMAFTFKNNDKAMTPEKVMETVDKEYEFFRP